MERKNLALAVILSLWFGPFGLLYVSVTGAAIMFVVNIIATFATLGVGLLVTWPACVVWAVIATRRHNEQLAVGSQVRHCS